MNVSRGRGNEYVSWMMDTSRDKLRWGSEVVSSHRAILGRKKAFWVPYAGYYILRARYYALRSKTELYIHSESAPRWIRNTAETYYSLLSYVHSENAPPWIRSATQKYWELRHKYGYGWLRYKYEEARARREMHRSSNQLTGTSSYKR